MPSFDITSEVDEQELDNAVKPARKELVSRFDFKGSDATVELDLKELKIKLGAEDASGSVRCTTSSLASSASEASICATS